MLYCIRALGRFRLDLQINTDVGHVGLNGSCWSDRLKTMYFVWRYPLRYAPLAWEPPWQITQNRITTFKWFIALHIIGYRHNNLEWSIQHRMELDICFFTLDEKPGYCAIVFLWHVYCLWEQKIEKCNTVTSHKLSPAGFRETGTGV